MITCDLPNSRASHIYYFPPESVKGLQTLKYGITLEKRILAIM